MANDMPDGFHPGFILDRARIQEVMDERIARGDLVMASQQPGIAGAWQRAKDAGVTAIILRECEPSILGRHRRPYLQRRGTCVSRAFARGVQASLDYSIAKLGSLQKIVTITFAAIYSIARVEVGKNRCGSGDGAIAADAAKCCHDFGVMTIEVFNGLTEDQIELLACKYAAPGQHTPKEWLEACNGHTCRTFAPDSLELCMDSIASGYATPYASGWTTALANAKGLSRLGGAGGHARCLTGVYVDDSGRDQLISSESWGRWAAGNPQSIDQTMDVEQIPCVTIATADGPRKLAPGDTGVDANQFWNAIESSGEAWSVSAPDFSGDLIADLTEIPTTV